MKAFGPDYEPMRTTTFDRIWVGRGGTDDREGRGKLFWAGSVKDLRIYDGLLTAEHIAAMAADGPYHRWKMDDTLAGTPMLDYGRGFALPLFRPGNIHEQERERKARTASLEGGACYARHMFADHTHTKHRGRTIAGESKFKLIAAPPRML